MNVFYQGCRSVHFDISFQMADEITRFLPSVQVLQTGINGIVAESGVTHINIDPFNFHVLVIDARRIIVRWPPERIFHAVSKISHQYLICTNIPGKRPADCVAQRIFFRKKSFHVGHTVSDSQVESSARNKNPVYKYLFINRIHRTKTYR